MTNSSERPIVFRCRGDNLVGVLHPAEKKAMPTVGLLVAVGGPQYRVGSHRQFVLMARAIAAHGFPVLRFDYRGMGDSDGETRTFQDVSEDIKSAIDAFMLAQPGVTGVVIWGLCDAASAAMMYCATDRRLRGLVLVNPWVRTDAGEARAYLHGYYLERLLQRSFWHGVFTGGVNLSKSLRDLLTAFRLARHSGARRSAASTAGFIERMLAGLVGFSHPVLAIVSDRDLTAQAFMDLITTETRWRLAVSSSRIRITKLSDSDHTFSTRRSLDRATDICVSWLAGLVSIAE
jgi:exosortase A-associated hydrolase 1